MSKENPKNRSELELSKENDLSKESESVNDKLPFYFRYPWAILVNPVETRQVEPLEVDLSTILPSFLIKLREGGLVDLQISGRALYSASFILRLQTDQIIKLMEAIGQITEDEKKFQDFPPLQVPLRISSKHVSLDELLLSLVDVLANTSKSKKRTGATTTRQQFILNFGIAPEKANIDTLISRVYERILQLSNDMSTIPFDTIPRNKKRIEIVRVFLSLLYL
ncbi:MAG: hypothetical protein KAR20_14465, partial [Candidatus Heimdallarchaeota archaeon]|nr:hypothetical protein [Candidatus Heimdallarchaeota archaeon]